MDASLVQRLARPAVFCLISFLAYGSQLLFSSTDLLQTNLRQICLFNTTVLCIWISYWRACYTDPGRIPPDWTPDIVDATLGMNEAETIQQRQRWCKKCEQFKPPRAHHCKTCKRYTTHIFHTLPCLTQHDQVYSKDGSPLPLDLQLRFLSNISSLPTFSLLRCYFNVLSPIFPCLSCHGDLG